MEMNIYAENFHDLQFDEMEEIEGGFKIFGMSAGSLASGVLAGAGIGNAIGGPIGGVVGGIAGCAVSYVYDRF